VNRGVASGDTRESEAGRICPLDYYYGPTVFARGPDLTADVLYVAGGLYGNLAAIDKLEALALAEQAPVTIVLNGDFHWFDADRKWFDDVEDRVSRHYALRGNVETEISRAQDIGAGCGCAYPPTVDDLTLLRSNQILAALKSVARDRPAACDRLSKLPMQLVMEIADVRIGIVHGDAETLAGWRFSVDSLDSAETISWLEGIRQQSQIEVFTSTHTCVAALRRYILPSGQLTVINNGAAGMPNFSQTKFGLVSRISARPSPHRPLYGTLHKGAHIDAIALEYDANAFSKMFLSRWSEESPAFLSYHDRIANGPVYDISQARLPCDALHMSAANSGTTGRSSRSAL
jgi:predicted phosphodiesterase